MSETELLYDHYKDTCDNNRQDCGSRNKMFIGVCVCVAALFLLVVDSGGAVSTLSSWLQSQHGITLGISISVIQTLIWVLLLYLSIRYFQLNMGIERQYGYIRKLEKRLGKSGLAVNREGEGYLDGYPKILDAVHIIYTWVFPIMLILSIITKIVFEWQPLSGIAFMIINTVVAAIIVVLTILYVYSLKAE
jgi:hypothetical protein